MATKDELSEQLALTQKLVVATDQMARSMSRIESSYGNQIAAVEKLTAAIDKLSSLDLNKLNQTKLTDVQKELQATEQSTKGLSGRMKDLGATVEKKLPKSLIVGAAALSGFYQGIKNVISLGKAVTGFFGGLISSVTSVAASIISIPFKMFSGLVDMAAAAGGGANELAQAIENLRKEMGDLKGPGTSAVIETTKTLQGFSDTGLSAYRVFGTMAERLQLVTKIAVTMGATFQVLRKEFEQNGGALLAFQKGLGATDEQMKAIGDHAKTMGTPMTKTFMDMTKQTLALGKAFDIDQKIIGKDMAKALQNVKHFGALTVKEIATASVYAKKLGVELDKITGTLDQFETFDSAAESAAKLSQSFGVNVDAFKLMEAQSPAEQIDMLRKSFRDAGVDASQFNRQQQRLLATTTGLDEATAKQVFSLKNQGVSMDDIKKRSDGAQKKAMTQAEAMSKLADSIERMVKTGTGQTGGFWDMFTKGIMAGFQSTKEFATIIMNIKRGLHGVYMVGLQLGRALPKLIPDLGEFLRGIGEFFNPAKFTKLFKGISDSISGFLSGKFTFKEAMEKFQKDFFDFFDSEKPAGKRVLESFKRMFLKLAKVIPDGIRWVAEKVAEGLKTLSEFIKDPSAYLAKAAAGGSGAAKFIAEAFGPIVAALKDAWRVLWPAFKDLMGTVWGKVKKFLMSEEFLSMVKPALPFIAMALFGPGLVRALLASLGTSLMKGLFSGGAANMIKKAVTSLVARSTGSMASTAGGRALGAAGPIGMMVAAAAGIGRGVDKYTSMVTSTMDRSSATIAAGATGLIDALTLGLLPDDFLNTIVNVLAKGQAMLFQAIGDVFGKGFGTSFKNYIGAQFEVLGNIWSLLKNLFTGDQSSFDASAQELGLSALRLLVAAFDFLAAQLPIMAVKLTAKILAVVTNITIKLITAQFGMIAKGVDELTGGKLGLTAKINALSDELQKANSAMTDKAVAGLSVAQDKIAASSDKLQNDYLRSAADKAKEAERQMKVTSDKVKDAQAAASTGADTSSFADVSNNIRVIKEVKKELEDPKFNLAETVNALKDKLSGVDFNIVTDAQVSGLGATAASLDSVSKSFSQVQQAMLSIKDSVIKGGVAPALKAVEEMVKIVSQMNEALSSMPKIDVNAKLGAVARSAGLGAKGSWTIKNKDIVLTVNLNVSMNVDEVEKIMVMRKSSIIRDRLNFATGDGAGEKGTPAIPETYSKTLPDIQKTSK